MYYFCVGLNIPSIKLLAKSDQIYGSDKCLAELPASRHSFLPPE